MVFYCQVQNKFEGIKIKSLLDLSSHKVIFPEPGSTLQFLIGTKISPVHDRLPVYMNLAI